MQTIFIIIKCSNEEHCLKILDLEINKGIAIIIQACDSVARKRGEKQGGGWNVEKKENFEMSTTSHTKGNSNSIRIKMVFFQSPNIQLSVLLIFIIKYMH